jgi:hypothetical protein
MQRRKQSLPEFSAVLPNILKYTWTTAELDFAYPLEISSSLYLGKVIAPVIMSMAFGNPNELEARIATRSFIYKRRFPELMCFDQSVTFCNPINIVQTSYGNNRVDAQFNWSVDRLAELFAEGNRINVDLFDGFVPNACHQEVGLEFKQD